MSRYAILAALPLALACVNPLEPVAGAEPFTPPAYYTEWWAQVEGCSGLRGELAQVRWFSVGDERYFWLDGHGYVIGAWRAPHDIYMAGGRIHSLGDVAHEMLHELERGIPGHDTPAWYACEEAGVIPPILRTQS